MSIFRQSFPCKFWWVKKSKVMFIVCSPDYTLLHPQSPSRFTQVERKALIEEPGLPYLCLLLSQGEGAEWKITADSRCGTNDMVKPCHACGKSPCTEKLLDKRSPGSKCLPLLFQCLEWAVWSQSSKVFRSLTLIALSTKIPWRIYEIPRET